MSRLAPDLERALNLVDVKRDRAVVSGQELDAATPWELAYKLAGALYERLHIGWTEQRAPEFPTRDTALEDRLRAVVPHRHTTVEVTSAGTAPGTDGEPSVLTPEGVRIRPAAAALDGTADPGTLRIAACRPALSPGFFLVDGPCPMPAVRQEMLRTYVHLRSPQDAVSVWAAALDVLSDPDASFRMKVLSIPDHYPRRDALVIYLPPPAWSAVEPLIARLGATGAVGGQTSPFAHRVAPGISLAFEAGDARRRATRLSFGQHRAKAIADGLVEAATSGRDRADAVAAALREANVDPTRPARNLDSSPLPVPGRPAGGSTTCPPHLLAASAANTEGR